MYWKANAVCKFTGCATFALSMADDPNLTIGEVKVHVAVQGNVGGHSCYEQHTRHCRQPERETLKGKLGEFSPMLLHTKGPILHPAQVT